MLNFIVTYNVGKYVLLGFCFPVTFYIDMVYYNLMIINL